MTKQSMSCSGAPCWSNMDISAEKKFSEGTFLFLFYPCYFNIFLFLEINQKAFYNHDICSIVYEFKKNE